MDYELFLKVTNLVDDIKKSNEYIEFKKAEKELESSDEVKILSYKKDMAVCDYEDTLRHFDKTSKESINSLKVLNEKAFILNSHPIVKNYNDKLTKLNLLLNEVEDIIFGDKDA